MDGIAVGGGLRDGARRRGRSVRPFAEDPHIGVGDACIPVDHSILQQRHVVQLRLLYDLRCEGLLLVRRVGVPL